MEKNDDSNAIVLVDTEKDTNDKRAEVIVSDKIEGLLLFFYYRIGLISFSNPN